ncbi:MAG: O-methyltransferase [Candidatus Izemoplasmatales bacterium]|jgi:predicted O-methyltransferase YrrM|nr:O-methyltransferase [Candidatus Izemoplasmatales bacterium]MDD4595276.1 O-methyltransferase [Candidatus Izemoplasmatales bacterium]
MNQFEHSILSQLEDEAIANKIPIMKPDGIAFLRQIILMGKVKTVLEIGTAIGYSAIAMAMTTDVTVVSIERNLTMFEKARNNVDSAHLADKIKLILADALSIDISDLGTFDLLFIDAAKGQNLPLFQKFASLVPKGGIIIIDNLLFHGFVENPETIISRDRRQMIHKIQQFNEWILNNDHYDSYIYNLGDGIGVCYKK